MRYWIKKIFVICIVILMGFSLLEFGYYLRDLNFYKKYINTHLGYIKTLPSITEKAEAIRDYVRKEIKPVSHGKFYNVDRRPFLRHTARETLIYKEGQCGEGTRVIINLLSVIGVKARRVYLCGEGGHVALEYYNGEKWIFLDSINSPQWFYKETTKDRLPVASFFGENKSIGCVIPPYRYGPTFTNYSYFWFGKIVPKSTGLMMYLHKPLPYMFTIINENPPLLLGIFFLVCASFLMLFCFLLYRRCGPVVWTSKKKATSSLSL